MAKISISMSDAMEEFVATRVESGEYNNTSEYFRDLVRRDQEKREAEDKLRVMIEKARASGVSEKTFDEIWEAGAAQARKKRRGG
ncbi:MAG: type II toxin-antitoxin system ParD family antitoxin [Hyphomonadaceae bacterium]|nr:type II toxin-antitoxin system ParD family antitoxin [Hyphomonadaceae bacterium]